MHIIPDLREIEEVFSVEDGLVVVCIIKITNNNNEYLINKKCIL